MGATCQHFDSERLTICHIFHNPTGVECGTSLPGTGSSYWKNKKNCLIQHLSVDFLLLGALMHGSINTGGGEIKYPKKNKTGENTS